MDPTPGDEFVTEAALGGRPFCSRKTLDTASTGKNEGEFGAEFEGEADAEGVIPGVLLRTFRLRLLKTSSWKSVAMTSPPSPPSRSSMPFQTRESSPVPAPSSRVLAPGMPTPKARGCSAIRRDRMIEEPHDCKPTEVGSSDEGKASLSVIKRGSV